MFRPVTLQRPPPFRSARVHSSNSQCDRQRGIFALSKTFFRRNTDVFQGKMARRSVKRSAARVRLEFSDTPLTNIFNTTCSSIQKGLLSVNYRRQALRLCLDPAVVAVIQIFNEFPFEVFHGAELLQIQQNQACSVRYLCKGFRPFGQLGCI